MIRNNFLYIDDNTKEEANGLITGLSNNLKIHFQNPIGNWEEERKQFLNKDFCQYDGLILDLNLEEKKNSNTDKISYYKGSTLAQELRNLSKSKEMKELPIILLSANRNLDKYFDQTNKDLFDLIISKESLNSSENFNEVSKRLNSIADAYKEVLKNKNLNSLLESNTEKEDIRFTSELNYQLINKPLHSIANFFIKELLEKDGILIKESILLARLGIDKIMSNQEELDLLINKHFIEIKYNGIFSEGWERWWMSKLDDFWLNISPNKTLRALDAHERVRIINNHFRLNLIPKEKHSKAKSSKFWTVCKGTGIYIDNIDGLLVAFQEKIFPWQDKEYICFEEALTPKNKEVWKEITESDKIKLELLKKKYPNERPNRR